MKFIKTASFLILVIILFSCDKDLMVDNSAKADFNLFFEYLKNDYAYRDYHAFTMDELQQKYLPQIEASNTQVTLANLLLKIQIEELKDPHLGMNSSEPFYLSTEAINTTTTHLERIMPRFKEIIIHKNSPYYTWGVVKSNQKIGYLYISAFNSGIGGANSLEIDDGVKEIDEIVQWAINENFTSMIIDIRSGAGGSNYVPRYIAQRFIDKSATYMLEYYPEGDSFLKKEWNISPSGTGFRTEKIALLSNGNTASGGEMFLLAMLQRDNLIHIGSRSAGASGNIVYKDLSNGWNFTLTNSRTEFPDNKQYFKVGILPEIIVKNKAPNYQETGNDRLIKKAIKELQ